VDLGYVTIYDSADVDSWSGLGYFIRRCLTTAGFQVEPIGPLATRRSAAINARRALHRYLDTKAYLPEREEFVGRQYARQVETLLDRTDIDVVLSLGTVPIAYLEVAQPVVFWTDATFAAMLSFYPGFTNLTRRSVKAGERMERNALERASLAIYASDWAAKSAVEHYGVDPAKVAVVPFGANIEADPTASEVSALIEARPSDHCRLLFIGVDWTRKGGEIAVRTAQELSRGGLPTELVVVGPEPSLHTDTKRFVRMEGFVDKRTESGRKRLESLLATSHFLMLPSRAECYGVALCEANAFGVPCLATNVGGIPSIIRTGVNGSLFELEDGPSAYAAFVRSQLADVDSYRRLAVSSYDEYQARLNWKASGRRVAALLRRVGGAR
jgi:glycosyltransferase involved in cell wall biosynthesis